MSGLFVKPGTDTTKLVREPDNLRNRYRRYCHAMRGYGWATTPLRAFAIGYSPKAYSAGPYDCTQTFRELVLGLHPEAWDQEGFSTAWKNGDVK